MNATTLLVACALISFAPAGAIAQPTPSSRVLLTDHIYDGVKASALLDSDVFSQEHEYLGKVRNLSLNDNGQINAVIVERARDHDTKELVFRLPWGSVDEPVHAGSLITNIADPTLPDFGIFRAPAAGEEFLVSEILGEYARLQAGQGYGYVKDAVFDTDGKLMAVLVARDAEAGGGTVAFAYPGRTGRWSPELSYYGLPFVSAEQANRNGLPVDSEKFDS